MIDWFASKISMLIFVAVALSLLLLFLGTQLSAFEFEKKVRTAEDIVQLIDTVPIGGAIDYEVKIDRYNMTIDSNSKTVTIDGAVRKFFASADSINISNAKTLEIKNSNGVVSVSTK